MSRKDRNIPGSAVVKTWPFNAGSVYSMPSQGCKIPYTLWPKRKKKKYIKQKQYYNKFNKGFFFFNEKKRKPRIDTENTKF